MKKCIFRVDDRSFDYNSPFGTRTFEDIEETGFYYDEQENFIKGFGDLEGFEKTCKKHKNFRKTICEFLANACYWNKISTEEIEFIRTELHLINIAQAFLIDEIKRGIAEREDWANEQYKETRLEQMERAL